MFRRFHERFGTAGLVVAVIALIAALAGTAIAAGGLTKKQEKQVIKIAKKYAGQDGTNGTNGTNGAPGEKGAQGEKGAKGDQGIQGIQGVKGDPGDPWTAGGVLPSGETETGAWGIFGDREYIYLPFNIPLETALSTSDLHYVNPAGEEKTGEGAFGTAENCKGSAANPTAEPGHICIYAETEPASAGYTGGEFHIRVYKSGVNFLYEIPAEGGRGIGTWAVTAPEAP